MTSLAKFINLSLALCLLILTIQPSFALKTTRYQIADLEHEFDDTIAQDATKWILSAQVSSDKTYPSGTPHMLGGPSILGTAGQPSKNQYFERTYTDLPPHDLISFKVLMSYSHATAAQTQYVKYMFDETVIEGEKVSSSDLMYAWVKGRVRHSGKTLRVRIVSQLNSAPDQAWFGFSDLDIAFANYSEPVSQEVCAFFNYETMAVFDKPCAHYPGNVGGVYESNRQLKVFKEKKCEDVANENVCLRCMNPFSWNGVLCSKCDLYCISCYGSDKNYECVLCAPGYALTATGKCEYDPNYAGWQTTSEVSVTVKKFTGSTKYIGHLNMPLPPNLEEAIGDSNDNRSPTSLQFGVRMSNGMADSFAKEPLPKGLENSGLHSSFLVNFFEQLITLCIIIFAVALFALMEYTSNKMRWQTTKVVFTNLKVLAKWNFLFIMIGVDIPDIILFASIEFRTLNLGSALSVVSLLSCLLMLGVTVAFFVGIFLIARKAQAAATTRSPNFVKKWQGSQIFYSGFNNNKRISQYFYLIYISRVTISAILGAVLLDAPKAQAVLQVVVTLAMLVTLVYSRPFEKIINFIQLGLIETLTFVTNLCVLGLTIEVSSGSVTSSKSLSLADAIITCSQMINILALVFLVNKITMEAVKIYENQKGSSKTSKTAYMQLLAVILQQGGHTFEEVRIPEAYNEKPKIAKSNKIFAEEKIGDESPELRFAMDSAKPLEASDISNLSPQQRSRLRTSSISPKKGFMATRTIPSQFELDDSPRGKIRPNI